MPSTITEADTYTATLSVPTDGESANSASLLTTFAQGLANRANFTKKRVIGAETGDILQVPLNTLINTSSRFTYGAPTVSSWKQTDVTSVGLLAFEPQRPKVGIKITGFRAHVRGAGGHAALPGTMPRLFFYRDSLSGGAGFSASVSDTSANTTAYQARHVIEKLDLSETISADYKYTLTFEGEAGANSLINLELFALELILAPS